jgi:hypothetical protein
MVLSREEKEKRVLELYYDNDDFESLYMLTKGKLSVLWKIYKELVIKRGMNIEEAAAVVDINLNILPDMKREFDQSCKRLAKKQLELDILDEGEIELLLYLLLPIAM